MDNIGVELLAVSFFCIALLFVWCWVLCPRPFDNPREAALSWRRETGLKELERVDCESVFQKGGSVCVLSTGGELQQKVRLVCTTQGCEMLR